MAAGSKVRRAYAPPLSFWAAMALIAIGMAAPARAFEDIWSRVPASVPADSLDPVLRRIEAQGPVSRAAAAAYALGQFHHARGEYRIAAVAFGRAAARSQGVERAEARYRQGLAWLGAREAARARAAFEEVAMLSEPYRALAQLGLAGCYALTGETDRELNVLRRLLDRPAGEAEPAALARYAALLDRQRRSSEAKAARERLAKRWPRSFEAALLPAVEPEAKP
jgi:hypothetical protein